MQLPESVKGTAKSAWYSKNGIGLSDVTPDGYLQLVPFSPLAAPRTPTASAAEANAWAREQLPFRAALFTAPSAVRWSADLQAACLPESVQRLSDALTPVELPLDAAAMHASHESPFGVAGVAGVPVAGLPVPAGLVVSGAAPLPPVAGAVVSAGCGGAVSAGTGSSGLIGCAP